MFFSACPSPSAFLINQAILLGPLKNIRILEFYHNSCRAKTKRGPCTALLVIATRYRHGWECAPAAVRYSKTTLDNHLY